MPVRTAHQHPRLSSIFRFRIPDLLKFGHRSAGIRFVSGLLISAVKKEVVVWPGYSNCRIDSCLGTMDEAWENQVRTDVETARSLPILGHCDCRMDESQT